MRDKNWFAPAVASLLAVAAPAALGQEGWNFSTGADYSQGKYGTPTTSRQWVFPFIAKYDAYKWNAKVTVPFVSIENPAVGRDGTPLPCAGSANAPRTSSGLGDVVLTGSYNVRDDRARNVLVDLTGKVKLGTGDEAECLGTGENDYSIQVDVTKGYGQVTSFGSLGWRKMGDPPGTNFKDPLYFSVGGTYKASDVDSVGIAYDYRQKLLGGRDPLSEATLFVTHRSSKTFRIQGYIVTGFSDSSPDRGGGALATWTF